MLRSLCLQHGYSVSMQLSPITFEVDWMVGQKVVLTTTSYIDDDPDSLGVSKANSKEFGGLASGWP